MLKVGTFAKIKLLGFKNPCKVYVSEHNVDRGTFVLLVIDYDSSYFGQEFLVKEKQITKEINSLPAPADLREWPAVPLSARLSSERTQLNYHQRNLSSLPTEVYEPDMRDHRTTKHYYAMGDWNQYWGNSQYSKISPRSEITKQHLRNRITLGAQRRLPLDRNLSRKSRKHLKTKQNIRNNPRGSSTQYIIPKKDLNRVTVNRGKLQRSWKKKAKPFPKLRSASVKRWIIPGNVYPHAPKGWPEKGEPTGSPEECLAFSGASSPTQPYSYPRWKAKKAAGLTQKLQCEHGDALVCSCAEARNTKYIAWVGGSRALWSYYSNTREYFEPGLSGEHIKPPDWPEVTTRRLVKCAEEISALEGAQGAEGLQYRDWFNENFYKSYGGHQGSCKCKNCARARYKRWYNG